MGELRDSTKTTVKQSLLESVDILLDNETITDERLLQLTTQIKPAVQEALEWLIRSQAKDKKIPDGVETMILTRMYKHMKLKDHNDFHWHIVASSVHS